MVQAGPKQKCEILHEKCLKQKGLEIAGQQWLSPITLVTQEADIRRVLVQRLPGQIVHETLSQKKPSQKKTHRMA
jgi:hypothetical protein